MLVPDVEPQLHTIIKTQAQQHGCQIEAIVNVLDHVHVLLQMPPTVACANVVKSMKGVSSQV